MFEGRRTEKNMAMTLKVIMMIIVLCVLAVVLVKVWILFRKSETFQTTHDERDGGCFKPVLSGFVYAFLDRIDVDELASFLRAEACPNVGDCAGMDARAELVQAIEETRVYVPKITDMLNTILFVDLIVQEVAADANDNTSFCRGAAVKISNLASQLSVATQKTLNINTCVQSLTSVSLSPQQMAELLQRSTWKHLCSQSVHELSKMGIPLFARNVDISFCENL